MAGVCGGLGVKLANKKLLVFVSSTYRDLIDERQAAVQAILKAGHIPAGMELFTAGDQSQLQTIFNWIDQSDVYMLILGGRYGSLEPKSKVSYTELEYDYAKAQGKPSFSVVISEQALEQKVRSVGSSCLEKENPKQLAQFREKVLSNVSSFFDDTKDIKLCVHESLGTYAIDQSLSGWISGRDIVDSSSMQKELEELRIENAVLKANAAKARPSNSDGEADRKYAKLLEILRDIELVIPANIAPDSKEAKMTLLDIFVANKDILVAGVTNSYNAGDVEGFYYYSVLPKLQIHELSENEKVAGVKYRRSYVNKEGQKFLAWYERRILEKKRASKSEKVPPAATVSDESSEPKPNETDGATTT